MSWLFVAILAYLILAIVFLADKHLLTDKIPDPKLYAFYSGLSGAVLLLVVPFIDFKFLPLPYIALAFASGISFFIALLFFYKTLKTFEVSRVVPAIGALTPLFSLLLAFIFSRGTEVLTSYEIPAFGLLIIGSFLINFERSKIFSVKSLLLSTITSFFFSLYFILAKYVYDQTFFLNGIVWLNLGGFLMAIIFFIVFKGIRREIFVKRKTLRKNTIFIFIGSKILSGLGGLLQNYAVFLAPSLVIVAIVNGLQGTQYAFLLFFTVLISLKFPQIIKEEITKSIIIQKSISILLIIVGLLILSIS